MEATHINKFIKYLEGLVFFFFFRCFHVIHKWKYSWGKGLRITFGFRSYFFSLDARQTFGWNVTNSGTMSQGFHWFAFFISLSFKEILAFGSWSRPLCLSCYRSKIFKAFNNASEDKLVFEVCSRTFLGNFQWSLFYKHFQNFVIAFIPTRIMEEEGFLQSKY